MAASVRIDSRRLEALTSRQDCGDQACDEDSRRHSSDLKGGTAPFGLGNERDQARPADRE